MQISNPNILKTVTNTKSVLLGKFLRILSSLQKCLFQKLQNLEIGNFDKIESNLYFFSGFSRS